MPATSIAISVKDNVSSAVSTMRNSLNRFDKDAEETSHKLAELQNKQKSLSEQTAKFQTKLDSASGTLKQAKKAFAETADEANRTKLEKAHEEYNKIQNDLKSITAEAKETQKQMRELEDGVSRASNRASGSGSSLAKGLATAGLGSMVGASLGQFLNNQISSAYGDATGTMISSTLSGAVTGAAIGSVIPGIGTAIGGIVGALSGAISGASQNFQAEDDAFKSYANEEYEGILDKNQSDLEAGSSIASGRENALISFTTLFGDEAQAKSYLDEMKTMANTTPFLYDDLAQMSKVLKTYGYDVEELIPQMTKIGDTGAALGMSTTDMSMVATAIGRMNSSGKTTLEYINPLIERGIPAIDYLAKALNMTQTEVYNAISKNALNGKESARIISDAMGNDFAGSMKKMSQTYSGLSSTLQGWGQEVQASMGQGYNDRMKDVMKEQIAFYEGDSGKRLQDAYAMIGQYKADIEGRKVDYELNAFDFITGAADRLIDEYLSEDNQAVAKRLGELRKEFYEAKQDGNGAKMEAVLAEAQNIADNVYRADTKTQSELEIQIGLLEDIKRNTAANPNYYNAGYRTEQANSKGLAASYDFDFGKWDGHISDPLSPEGYSNAQKTAQERLGASRAIGIPYIPRDDYLIRAHEGERLLTADEARRYNAGGNGTQVLVTMNGVTIREEADIDKVASELAWQIHKQQMIGAAM